MCTQLLIVQLPATGASRPFPWGAGELRPPELGLAAKLSRGGRRGWQPHVSCGPHAHKPLRAESHLQTEQHVPAWSHCCLVGAASCAGTVPPRARQALSATMGMAEAFQSPSACFNYCCVLALNSSSSLFSDCQFLVLTNPFQMGGKDGEEEFNDSLSDQEDVP